MVYQHDGVGFSRRFRKNARGGRAKIGTDKLKGKNVAPLLELFAKQGCNSAPTPAHGTPLDKLDTDEKLSIQAQKHYQGSFGWVLYLNNAW